MAFGSAPWEPDWFGTAEFVHSLLGSSTAGFLDRDVADGEVADLGDSESGESESDDEFVSEGDPGPVVAKVILRPATAPEVTCDLVVVGAALAVSVTTTKTRIVT